MVADEPKAAKETKLQYIVRKKWMDSKDFYKGLDSFPPNSGISVNKFSLQFYNCRI